MKKNLWILFVIFLATNTSTFAQSSRFLIEFTDKDTINNPFILSDPEEFLSERAIDRRERYGIPLEISDLPLSPRYIDSIKPYLNTLQNKSKWMNSLVAEVDSVSLDSIRSFSFVKNLKFLAPPISAPSKKDLSGIQVKDTSELKEATTVSDSIYYGYLWEPISMLNGHLLHKHSHRGDNMVIAVLDAGFRNVDKLPVFQYIRQNNQILGTRDFAENDSQVYDTHSHGTMVLSLMAGYIPEVYIGTAPEAEYWLLRTEVGGSEYLIEEYNWIAGAEFADSAGTDIINSSLGYTTFDDSTQNHTFQDMNGETTPISKAASMAASKGMLVVSSAGNQGNEIWQYISAPADADSIISVGSVDPNGKYAFFSSTGPTYDGRIKPELAAQGISNVVQNVDSSFIMTHGTSFSTPIISGLAACLWQKFPELSNIELKEKLIRNANQYASPDSLLGYGIPNFARAGDIRIEDLNKSSVEIFPNPFKNHFYINIPDVNTGEGPIYLEIYDLMGRKILNRQFTKTTAGNRIRINALSDTPTGIYLIKLSLNPDYTIKQKIVKH
ncbi:MAG: S8 family serine peptidase [Bacteroidales bacterium]|nr:S8 family serine peptidase [Bacteroidales bacterium]